MAERLELDLQREDVAVKRLDHLGLALLLQAERRHGLVQQVDRRVGQLPLRQVAGRIRRRGDERRIADADTVVHLVAGAQTTQDGHGRLGRRLQHRHGLEATGERRVLFNVPAVLVVGGRAGALERATRKHRLHHVGRVHRALGLTEVEQHVHLVNEHDHLALLRLDVAQERLKALLKRAAERGAGEQRAQVKRTDALVLQRLGHLAVHDPLCEALHDGRLTHTSGTHKHGVRLGAPREHLDGAPDLAVTTNHGVQFALPGELGQVLRVLFERLARLGLFLVGAHPHAAEAAAWRLLHTPCRCVQTQCSWRPRPGTRRGRRPGCSHSADGGTARQCRTPACDHLSRRMYT